MSSDSSSSSSDSTKHRKRSPLTNQQNPKTIVIKQNVKNARKGPYAIKRKLDLNAVVIQRRFGEGSRPIFDRDDVRPNSPSPKTSNKKRKSISPSRTPEYNKNKNYNSSPIRKKRLSYSPTPKRKRTPDKVPYYADPVREQDRIKQKYKIRGRSSRSRSRSPRKYRTRSRSPIGRSRRRNTRSRSPSRSYHRNYSHRRTPSRDRERHRSLRRRSISRSSSRKRSRNSPSYDRATAPHYIPVPTIPVPVEYAHLPAPRWIPPPVYPRYPVMPRPPPMYPYHTYYPGYGPPMAALPPPRHYQTNHPRFRGGRAGRTNRNYSETAKKTGT